MGLTVTSDDKGVKVYVKNKEWSGGSFKTYSIGISSKGKDGNWVNGYLDAQFKKDDANKITNKCKIHIKNAFFTVSESNGKKYTKLFITEFDVLEAGETPNDSADGFVSIDDGDVPDFMKVDGELEEMPFK